MKNILFADDDENFRFTIKEYFSDSPWHWDMAENGVVALDHALAKKYDLIILDINMPFMKGTEAIKVIKTQWPEIRVLAFTADYTEQKIAEYYNDGFDGVVAKPIELVKLHQTISKFLDPFFIPRPSNETVFQTQKSDEKLSHQTPVLKQGSKEPVSELSFKEEVSLSELPSHLLVKNIEILMREKKELLEKIRTLETELDFLKMARGMKAAGVTGSFQTSVQASTLTSPNQTLSKPTSLAQKPHFPINIPSKTPVPPASEPLTKGGPGIPTFELE